MIDVAEPPVISHDLIRIASDLATEMHRCAEVLCCSIRDKDFYESDLRLIYLEFDEKPEHINHFFLFLDEAILGYSAWPKVASPREGLDRSKVTTQLLLLMAGDQTGWFLDQPNCHGVLVNQLQDVTSEAGGVLMWSDFIKTKFPLVSSCSMYKLRRMVDPRSGLKTAPERRAIGELLLLSKHGVTPASGFFSDGLLGEATDLSSSPNDESSDMDDGPDPGLLRRLQELRAEAAGPARDTSGRFCRRDP
jgi:hypothetical protein